VTRIKGRGWDVSVERDVAEMLREGGVDLGDVGGIIWRYLSWVVL